MFPRLLHLDSFKIFGHDFGGLTIHTYGLMLALAFFSAFLIAYYNARREGIPEKRMHDIFFYIVISGLFGGKLLHIIVEHKYYWENPHEIIFALVRLGGVYYGGIILSVIVSIMYLRYHKLSIRMMGDFITPGIALGLSIARWGCLSAGCCFGKATTVPWAIVYTDEYAFHTVGTPIGIPVHPAPVYESIAAFLIFLFLMYMIGKRKFIGQVFSLFFILNGIERFIIEYFRADERGYLFNNLLTTSQFIALFMVVFWSILYYLWNKASKGKDSYP